MKRTTQTAWLPLFILLATLSLLSCQKERIAPLPPWKPLTAGPNLSGFQKISFFSEQIGWVSGGISTAPYHAVVLRTLDAGTTWAQVDLRLYAVGQFITLTFVDQNILYACGTDLTADTSLNRRIYKSTDGGATWAKRASTGFVGSFNLHFFTEQVGVSANASIIQKTTDGGQTWRTTYSAGGVNGLDKLRFLTPLNGFAAGGLFYDRINAGTLLHTLDGGETWQPVPWPHGAITQIDFVSATVGYISTVPAKLYKTTDGGQTWNLVNTPIPGGSAQVFPSEQEAYVGGIGGIWHTQDAGATWQNEYSLSGTSNGVNGLCFPTPRAGYAVTDEGLILKKILD